MNEMKYFAWTGMLLLLVLGFNRCNFTGVKPKLYVIEIKDMKFQPALLKVNKGDTVEWINHDIVTHDITEEKSHEWSSSPLPADSSWRMVAETGADYYCSIHQVMKGKLEVK